MENKERPDIYQVKSERQGLAGLIENLLRKFNTLFHMLMLLPLYLAGCVTVGAAALPGVLLFRWVFRSVHSLDLWSKSLILGMTCAACYLLYGFSMILIVPLINFVGRAHLKPWRGPYYSLPAIRWYIHNGSGYLVRYTFLEFITPTPFAIFFFQMMGMKIGRGTVINTSHISDYSLIELGEKVTLGGSVTIVAHYGQGGYLVLAPVKIGHKVTVGLRAVIMGGAEIGDGAKILPNSVVMPKTKIPAGETWGGVPAQRLDPEALKKAA